MSELSLAYKIPLMVVALLIAIIGHEIMHGYVAYRYGDSTAKDSGRLSLNPIVHIDLIGSILVPAFIMVDISRLFWYLWLGLVITWYWQSWQVCCFMDSMGES